MARRFVDLSMTLCNDVVSDPPPLRPTIEYQTHKETAYEFDVFFPNLDTDGMRGGNDGFAAAEWIKLTTHNGTHVDAPYHYHPTQDGGERAITIDEVPLEWCFGAGVKLDFRDRPNGYTVTAQDVEDELGRIGHTLNTGDIVLVNTAAGALYGQPEYVGTGCGMGREATLYLTERGVRVCGTDAWSWDPPLMGQSARARETGDWSIFWEGHKAGADTIYCYMEKLANLDQLPDTGFEVTALPVNVANGSAGWCRPVAILEG